MIRITAHPADANFLLLKVPQGLNEAMGTFGPATLAVDLRGYVMPKSQIDSLVSWARYHDVRMLNEVREKGEPTRPLECANDVEVTIGGKMLTERCAAPLRVGQPFCGTCGQPPRPVQFEAETPLIGQRCTGCGHINKGGPSFCVRCGMRMPDQHLHTQKPADREHLSEPQSLADSLAKYAPTGATA